MRLMHKAKKGPQYHPTDVGHVKLASHLMQYIKLKFEWVFGATGPEVQADTLYWNDGEFLCTRKDRFARC